MLNLYTAVARLIEIIEDEMLKLQVLDIAQRIHELELRQLGTELIEDAVGFQIGD